MEDYNKGSKDFLDWTRMFKKYGGLWVALKDDQKTVIVSGKTNEDVLLKAKQKGFERPITMKIPEKLIGYVG